MVSVVLLYFISSPPIFFPQLPLMCNTFLLYMNETAFLLLYYRLQLHLLSVLENGLNEEILEN